MSTSQPERQRSRRANTVEEPAQAPAPAEGSGAEVTEVLSNEWDSEEVYVILPEGSEGDVPVVETEIVEGTSGVQGESELAARTAAEDVPLTSVNPLSEGGPEPAEPSSFAEPRDLESFATELEEDFLSTQGAGVQPRRAGGGAAGAGHRKSALDSIPNTFTQEEWKPEPVRKSSRLGVWVSLAAVLLLSVAGFLTYPQWQGLIRGGAGATPLVTSGGSAGPAGAGNGAGATSPAGGAGVGTAPATASGGGPAVDLAAASRQTFREKLILAIELGYVGEVSNE